MTNEIRLIHILSAIIIVVSTVYSLWIVGRWLVHRPAFDIELIHVKTLNADSLHINAKHIENSISQPIIGNFFTADLSQVQQVFEEIPWVRKASVRRVWPRQLEVILEEQKVFAIWNDTQLMNTYAEVFTANIGEVAEWKHLPSLSGPDGTEIKVVRMYQDLIDWTVQTNSSDRPIALTLNNRYSWNVRLASGVLFYLGREKEDMKDSSDTPLDASIQQRYRQVLTLLPQMEQLFGSKIVSVDLRYPLDRLAVRTGKEVGEDVEPALAD